MAAPAGMTRLWHTWCRRSSWSRITYRLATCGRCCSECGRAAEAATLLAQTLQRDPLDWWALHLTGRSLDCDSDTCLDIASCYADAGFSVRALAVLDEADVIAKGEAHSGTRPLINYRRQAILEQLGAEQDEGDGEPTRYCFPWLLDDHDALVARLRTSPDDAAASHLLATWFYAHGRRVEAQSIWSDLAQRGSTEPLVWRALAFCSYNEDGDITGALAHSSTARALAPHDGRLLFEFDQLAQRAGREPAERLRLLQEHAAVVALRDDLTLELAETWTDVEQPEKSLELLRSRRFQPWEGGEGRVVEAWERTLLALAQRALGEGHDERASTLVREAMEPPLTLGEARHPLRNTARLWLALGDALAGIGDAAGAQSSWRHAAEQVGDFRNMAVDQYGEATIFSVIACRRLGWQAAADALVEGMAAAADQLDASPARIDYFATSLPRLLNFSEDLAVAQAQRVRLFRALVRWCRGATDEGLASLQRLLTDDPNARFIRDLLQWLRALEAERIR